MTLPTGVSTLLLECLDVDSTAYYSTDTSDSLSNCPSPETFRDEASERSNLNSADFGKYKNSTLLDSSKAMTIDKIPQISNLSAILEPALDDFQDKYTRRKRLSNCSYTSSALNVSTIMAGKKVCKITAARETTPDLKTGMRCSSPLGPERKPAKQTAKCKRLKSEKKEKTCDTSGEGPSSFSQLGAPGDPSAKSGGLTAQILTSKQTSLVVPLCGREICSIVRTSPQQRSSRPHRTPANKKAFSFPKRLPEDNITSTKNWIYCKRR
ncbi:hypothetical protein N311_02092 [Apaloderma vittatum]|nr:hypothetical protein N311_02092 [Apaloderma vittatum]